MPIDGNRSRFAARPTTYNGIRMRSRLEARFAQVLDQAGMSWKYEPMCFASGSGQYLPDFALQTEAGYSIYIEVKPAVHDLWDPIDLMHRMAVIWHSEPDAQLWIAVPNSYIAVVLQDDTGQPELAVDTSLAWDDRQAEMVCLGGDA